MKQKTIRQLMLVLLAMVFLFTATGAAGAEGLNPYTQGFIEGYLLEVNTGDNGTGQSSGYIQIESYDGQVYNLGVSSRTSLSIDQVPVRLSDFKKGMEVYGELRGRRLILLEGYSTSKLGYISPGSKVRKGLIKKIDRNHLLLQEATGQEKNYYTFPGTIVQKEGQNLDLSILYEGDRVKLFFDEVESELISRIEVEGKSLIIKDLYQGKLIKADRIEDRISLEKVQVLRNGQWQTYKQNLNLPYDQQVPVYIGRQQVPYQNLKYYQGKDIYLLTRNYLGGEHIEKMIIKDRYESIYEDRIDDINWYTESFELENHQNVAFHDGTIIIKDGRLVDKYALNTSTDALVIADGRLESKIADVVYILNQEVNNSSIGQHYLYAGRLDQIAENQFWLKKFYILSDNEWESFRDEKELFYDNDSSIYDLESRNIISSSEFYSGPYAVDEDSNYVHDNHLKDCYAYIYTDGDRAATVVVQKDMDSLLKQRVSCGIAARIYNDPLAGWILNIRESRDWSRRHEEWVLRSRPLNINLDKAMLIKNDKIIEAEELQPGDYLYIVRDDYEGKVIIVK